jgi:hypothetical protein
LLHRGLRVAVHPSLMLYSRRPPSGQITCYLTRTFGVLTTDCSPAPWRRASRVLKSARKASWAARQLRLMVAETQAEIPVDKAQPAF